MPSEGPAARPTFADGRSHRTSARTVALSIAGVVSSVVGFVVLAWLPQPPGQSDSPILLVAFLAALLFRSISEPLTWWSRTFRVGERSLRVDHGVLARHRQEVPYDRIQQVDVQRPLLAQLVGVAALRIDTAGEAGQSSVVLRFLERGDAEALRAHLLRRRDEAVAAPSRPPGPAAPPWSPSGAHSEAPWPAAPPGFSGPPGAAPPPPPPEVPIASTGPARIVVSALTEEVVLGGAVLVAAGALWTAGIAATGGDPVPVALGSGVVAALVVGLAVVATAASVLRWWGYTLGARGDDLHLRHGLLDVRELTVPRRRIQHLTILDNPVRRAIGFATVHLRSAAAPGAANTQSTSLVLPYVDRRELDALLEALAPGHGWVVPPLQPRTRGARRRAIRRRATVLACVVAVPALATWPGGAVLVAAVALGVPWGVLAHRRAGSATTERVVVLAHGAVRHRTEVVPVDRIQSCRTSSSPFQRRAGLATLAVDVAAPSTLGLLLPSTSWGAPRLFDADAGWAAAACADLPRRSR